MMSGFLKERIIEYADLTEAKLRDIFNNGLCGETGLRDASEYSVLGGGKRIRAFLLLEFCNAFGGDIKSALPFAAAIEMIHAFSLVHDDMPCMDNDDMRRGKPSTHKAFGEAEALLCGDELFCLAFEVAASNDLVGYETRCRVITEFARGAGALGMAGGQHYDLCELPSNYDELVRLHRMKTGALIAASCINGYLTACDDPDETVCEDIRSYAYDLGLAFQIIDDVLDITSDPETLGKPIGSDEEQGKVTSLSFFTVDEARNEAAKLTARAKRAIEKYDGTKMLCDFADYLLYRIY